MWLLQDYLTSNLQFLDSITKVEFFFNFSSNIFYPIFTMQVSVPYNNLSMVVTVRCGHCSGILPVNMAKACFVPNQFFPTHNQHEEMVLFMIAQIFYLWRGMKPFKVLRFTFGSVKTGCVPCTRGHCWQEGCGETWPSFILFLIRWWGRWRFRWSWSSYPQTYTMSCFIFFVIKSWFCTYATSYFVI